MEIIVQCVSIASNHGSRFVFFFSFDAESINNTAKKTLIIAYNIHMEIKAIQ